jgi:trk system potassium uptake protein TrkA
MVAAKTLSDTHDVLVIEKNGDIADVVKNRLNVSVLNVDGTNPKSIDYAMKSHKPDMVISTLGRDDSNLFICMMVKRHNPDTITIASVTDPDFVIQTTAQGVPGVDIIISPELITADKMFRLCTIENAIDYEDVPEFGVKVAVMNVPDDSPLLGKVVMNIIKSDDITVFAAVHDDSLIFQVDSVEIHAGDHLYMMGTEEAIERFNFELGVKITIRDIVILGGTIVGQRLAELLIMDKTKRYVRLIEKDQARSKQLSKMSGILVIGADFTEPDIQKSENIFKSDCLVTVTDQDDTNLLMCMAAHRNNTNKVVSRYIKKEYIDIFSFDGLQTIVGFDRIVANEISKCVMSESKVLMRMREQNEILFIHDVNRHSKLQDKYYGDIKMPERIRILAIYRNGGIIYPKMDTMFLEGDMVLVFTNFTRDKELARIFGRNVVTEG